MNTNLLHILRLAFDRRMTAPPIRALRELKRRGIERLPGPVQAEFDGSRPPRLQALKFVLRWLDGERLTRHGRQWVLNSFMPPFPGPAYERMFENLLSGRKVSPVSAFLAVTGSCPYRCWHCSIEGRSGGTLSTETWLRAIRELHQLGTSIIGFTGGEPLCRTDLCDLIHEASTGGAAIILFTSGALLDDPRVRELKRAGLWALCVSFDDPVEAEHDRLRGKNGAFQQAVRAVNLSTGAGFYTMIGSVATPRMIRERRHEALHALGRKLEVHELRFVEPMPCGKLGQVERDQLLQPEDVLALREFHRSMNRKGARPKICAFNQVESPDVFGCGAGTQHLFIDPAGNVCPCDFTPLGFGNICEVTLESIWQRMSAAMGGYPRRTCFIQQHAALVAEAGCCGYPLSPETSEAVCANAPWDGLPEYFATVMGQETKKKARP